MQHLNVPFISSFLFILSIASPLPICAAEWPTLLQQYRAAIGEETYTLLSRQLSAYTKGTAPAIAVPSIKEIPIQECGEALVDVNAAENSRIRTMEGEELLQAHEFPEDIDPRASTHGMVRQGVFDALGRMIDELDKLAPQFGYTAGELEIRLFEGLRDLETQKQLFDDLMEEIKTKNPHLTEQEVYQETARWVSPYKDNVPAHSTGGAIDIHLFSNKKKAFCPMGRFNQSGSLAPTFSTDVKLSQEEQCNRLLMLTAATRAGLTNYVYEFWHYSLGDRYAAYWRIANPETRNAQYGSK